jgi:hypothetical protein
MMAAQSPRLPLATGISRLSISARLVLLSSILLLILAGTSLYLSSKLEQNAEALRAEAHYVEVLQTASAAEKAFGDLKYWLTDLAVSLLNLSEQRANEASMSWMGSLLCCSLRRLDGRRHPPGRRRGHNRALAAVDAYTDDHRVIGNSLMAEARVHISGQSGAIWLVTRLKDQATQASEAARRRPTPCGSLDHQACRHHRHRPHPARAALDRRAARPHGRAIDALTEDAQTSRSPRPAAMRSALIARCRCSATGWWSATGYRPSASRRWQPLRARATRRPQPAVSCR